MKRDEMVYLVAAGALAAGLVAATNPDRFGWDRGFLYLYWLSRIAIEGGLFVAFRSLLETAGRFQQRPELLIALAFLLSLIPFVLATTAFDIILGFPELGLERALAGGPSVVQAFLLEIVYLADDHLFLCVLLSLPRLLKLVADDKTSEARPRPSREQPLLPMLDPPLDGNVIRLEAQEHYVLIVSTQEQRLVLGRFSDFAATLPESLGLKVHRSHWVANRAAAKAYQENRNMKLRLTNGDVIPVSRRYRKTVAALLG